MNDYEARKEARIERLRERAAKKAAESTAAYNDSRSMMAAIPMGQPILIGHYSEKADRRYRDRAWNKMGKSVALSKEAEELERRAEAAEENTAISSDDPEAVVKLKEKLADLEKTQADYKAVNAAYRKFLKKPESLDASDLPESVKTKIRNFKPEWSGDKPIAGFYLTNNNANIRRVKERIAELTRKASEPERPPLAGDGWSITEDREDNRVYVRFDVNPDYAARTILKSHGFRWKPSVKAWSRQLNNSARWNAEAAIKRIFNLESLS